MRYAILALMFMCCSFLFANLAMNQPFEYIQPDGTKLQLFVSGDEFYRRVHDQNNFTIVLDPASGAAVYAVPNGSGLKPSAFIVGQAYPQALGIQPGLMQDEAITKAVWQKHQTALGTAGDRAPSTGTINNIFVFVRFNDQSEYTQALSIYDSMANSSTGVSMRDYFGEESDGDLIISTTFYPAAVGGIVRSFQDSHDRGYFMPYSATNTIGYPAGPADDPDYYGYVRLQTMMRAAILSIASSVPAGLNIDGDADGNVDNVTFVAQGAAGGWADPLWPHHWTLHLPTATYINSKRVWDYNMQLSSTIDTGVICHEMSHSMGFPDLYHYRSAYSYLNPAGSWDLMEWDQETPQHHLTYMKWKYGDWFTSIPTITPTTTPTQYTLTAIDQNPFSCYKVASTQANQFYVIEYRRDTGRYESSIPGSGLIVSRIISTFDGEDMWGNAQGPPDEVYVYRPGGDIDTEGTVDNANFSSQTGRTALNDDTNPEPWLYSNTHTQLDGNLVLSGISSSGGTTMTFYLSTDPPNYWDGSSSNAWGTASNWSLNSVPTVSQYVVIPSGMPNNPVVTAASNCKHLTLMTGATLTVNTGTLNVDTDFICYGQLAMSNAAGNLYVGGDLVFEDGATSNVSVSAEIYIVGNMEFRSGSSINMTSGYIEFYGSGNSFIRTYTPSTICHLRSDKDDTYYVNISNLSTAVLTISGAIYVYDGSKITQGYSGTTILMSNLNVYTGGLCTFSSGTLSMEGSSSSTIGFADAGSYLKNLRINKAASYYVTVNSSNLQVNGNLTIDSGALYAQSYTIGVAGNWTNNVGLTAFNESTSTIVLNGAGTQTLSSEDFNNLELNKSAGNMVIPTGSTVNCATYNWTAGDYTVSGGTFSVADLVDTGIMGVITLSGGTINYHQDTSNYVDLRAYLTISNGTFNVYGGSSICWFSYIDSATLSMTGGTLDIKDQGIYINTAYPFNDFISGGTIKTKGSFDNRRGDFNPTGGTIFVYGPDDCVLTCASGSNLFNVTINKPATREADFGTMPTYTLDRQGNHIPITRNRTVTGTNPLDINGVFRIEQGIFIAPATITVAGNWQNLAGPDAFVEGTGTVEFDGSSHQYCNSDETFYNLNINKSAGALRVNYSPAEVICEYYTWISGAVDVLLGSFTANDLTQNGIYGNFYTNPGGTINLHQGLDQWIDLNGLLNLNGGGTINIYGGSMNCYWAYTTDATINMTGGDLNFIDRGITITSTAHALTVNVTGGTIRCNGGYLDSRSGVVLSGGTLEFTGTTDCDFSLATDSHVFNVIVNKTGGTRDNGEALPVQIGSNGRYETIVSRSNTLTAVSNLEIHGSFTISAGTFNVDGNNVLIYYPLHIYGTLQMNNPAGLLNVWDDINWYASSSSNVTAGNIYCRWNWLFQNGCTVNLTGSTVRMNSDYGASLTNQSPTAQFGNLEIYATEEDPITTYSYTGTCALLVNGNLTIYPTNTLNLNEGLCTVTGNTLVQETGIIEVGDGGTLTITGNLDLHGAMVTGPGTAIIHGDVTTYNTSSISVDQGIFKCDAPWATPFVLNLYGAVSINGGTFELTYRTIVIQAHATRIWNNATLRIGKGFTASLADCYKPTGTSGGLYLIGIGNPVLEASGGNWFTNLYIQKQSSADTAYLQDDAHIKNNLTISSGRLNANDFDIFINGTWTNSAGANAFLPGTGTVSFDKTSGTQNVIGSTNFYNVVDNHSGAALDFQGPTGISHQLTVTNIVTFQNTATLATVDNAVGSAILAFYNAYASTIASYMGGGNIRSFYSGNSVNIADVVQNGLYGAWTADGGQLIVHQDSASWPDMNGVFLIQNNGIIDIYGGAGDSYFAYGNAASLYMYSGELNFHDHGFSMTGSSHTASISISGGTISVNGNFSDSRGIFIPTGGSVKMTGAVDAALWLTTPSVLHNLIVDKTSTRVEAETSYVTDRLGNVSPVTRSANLNLSCDGYLNVNGNFTVQNANSVNLINHCQINNAGTLTISAGTLNLGDFIMQTTGNIDIYGTLRLPPASILKIAPSKNLYVRNGGVFISEASLANYCTVTRNGATGYYNFKVESGGTISSYNTIFEYMNTYGIFVDSGATVDPISSFSYCTFRHSASGGTLLRLDNNQTLTINGANFPANTWGGTSNVSKTLNQGQVTFTNFTGDFSGTAFEHDPYNRITWFVAGVPAITDLHIERSGINNIRLWWTYPDPYDLFNIYASDKPEGPFILVGTSTSTQWMGSTISLSKAFYRVSVVYEP